MISRTANTSRQFNPSNVENPDLGPESGLTDRDKNMKRAESIGGLPWYLAFWGIDDKKSRVHGHSSSFRVTLATCPEQRVMNEIGQG
jgi:hypothetical protein